MITPEQFKVIAPRAPQEWIDAMIPKMADWSINTPARQAAFLAQMAYESNEFTEMTEDLNYSVEGLCRTWPSHFPTHASAEPYAMRPEKLANFVYANRIGNGGPETGDGWMYRARGPTGLTFRANYHTAGNALKLDLEKFPELVLRPEIGCDVACWFFSANCLISKADNNDFEGITRTIHGSIQGANQPRRTAYYDVGKKILGVA